MSFDDMRKFIDVVRNTDDADFTQQVPRQEVEAAEAALGLTFPPSYRHFVEQLGAGDVNGQEFYGVILGKPVESSQTAPSVGLTLRERAESGLPDALVLVGDTGMGEYYVIDTSAVSSDDENPIGIWSAICSEMVEEDFATDFGAFALGVVDARSDDNLERGFGLGPARRSPDLP